MDGTGNGTRAKRTILHVLYEKQKQSPYYDNLCRPVTDLLPWIARGARGVTSNPAIFDKAMASSNAYNDQLRELVKSGKDVENAYWELIVKDIQDTCKLLEPIYNEKDGEDGYVSVQVSPKLVDDTRGYLQVVISTIPEQALKAFMDHGTVSRTLDTEVTEAQRKYKAIEELGVDWNGVGSQLEAEVLDSFTKCYDNALQCLQKKAPSCEFITV